MGKSQREKGKRGERELAGQLREYGYDCRRGQQYCGCSGAADVVGLPGIHIEFHRRDYEEWLVTMRLEEWIHLYREWESGRELG